MSNMIDKISKTPLIREELYLKVIHEQEEFRLKLVRDMNEALAYLRDGELPVHNTNETYRSGYKNGCLFAAEVIDNLLYQLKLKRQGQ